MAGSQHVTPGGAWGKGMMGISIVSYDLHVNLQSSQRIEETKMKQGPITNEEGEML